MLGMSKFDKEQLRVLQKLCRIRLNDEEEERLLKNLTNIIACVEELKEVNTVGVKPCSHVLSHVKAPLRSDEEAERLIPREEFLKNAPQHVGGMIKVPKVIHEI